MTQSCIRPDCRRANWLLSALVAVCFLCLSAYSNISLAGDTYFTDTDNENNALTQVADGDLDTLIDEPNAIHPIEFNIDLTGALPATEAHLAINAFDIDEEAFELNQVFINGNLLGTLYGISDEDTTTIFSVPTNQIVAGNNLIEILVDPDGWSLRVNWGQLLVDGGAELNAEITDSKITSYTANIATSTLNVNVDLDINTTGDYRIELNLLDESNNNISYATQSFSANAGDQLAQNYQFSYNTSSFTGTYTVEALLFYDDGAFNVQEDLTSFNFDHLQTVGPRLPAQPTLSTITASNAFVVADGTTDTTITVQGIDSTTANTFYSGQTVTLATTAGTLSAVTDNGNGTYSATLTAASSASVATITGTMDGVPITDTATVSFVPGTANRNTTTITAAESSIEANGLSTTVITVQTIDAFGNNLTTGGNSVILATTHGTLDAISDQGDGTYVTTLTSSTLAGNAIISGTLNGTNIVDTETVNFFIGPANINNTTINASLAAIYADGSSESVITVRAFDFGGNALVTGGDNIILSSNLGSLTAITDNGDGTYNARLRSLTIPGTASVSGLLGGSLIADSTAVEFVEIPTVDPLSTNTATPTITGTINLIAGASLSVSVGGVTYPQSNPNLLINGNLWSLQIPSGNALSDGTYEVTASVTDSAAQTSVDSSANELYLDLIPPTVSLNALPQASVNNILTYDISGTCTLLNDVLSITITDEDGGMLQILNIACPNGSFTEQIDLQPLQDGLITIQADILDLGGNLASDSVQIDKNSCIPTDIETLCDDDKDGIPNGIENILGTNPQQNDSDGDGITDDDEFGNDVENPSDTDGDGILDALDTDSDNDGIPDAVEAGPIPGSPRDTDNDGRPDYQDRDSDNDRVPDSIEFAYFDLDPDNDGRFNYIDIDSDGDGLPDALENGASLNRDSDFDGIDDVFDVDVTGGQDNNNDGVDDSVRLKDTDGDGRYNMFDIDSDNDGISEGIETGLSGYPDTDGDGINDFLDVDQTGGMDNNGDGIDDAKGLNDTDGDGIPDHIDLDSDNDSILDVEESGGTDLAPVDGMVDDPDTEEGQTTPTDSDGDGIPDYQDLQSDNPFNNGTGAFDINQNPDSSLLDQNNDGTIDIETDADQDGVPDTADDSQFGFGSNADFDGDGINNDEDLDDDNDGIPDSLEGDGSLDSDGDGFADSQDLDSDNDGITDLFESQLGLQDNDEDGRVDNQTDLNNDGIDDNAPGNSPTDTDGDGSPDFQDTDSDGDSISDLEETAEANNLNPDSLDQDGDGRADNVRNGQVQSFINPVDSDNDGQADYIDTDSDNDGISDAQEAGDIDNDGNSDRLQSDNNEIETAIGGAGTGSINLLSLFLLILGLAYQRYRKIRRAKRISPFDSSKE